MRYGRSLEIASRHDKLIELLRSGEFSSPALARKLRVSQQTVYRDIEFLKHCGYAIRPTKHSDSWAYHLLVEPTAVSSVRGVPR